MQLQNWFRNRKSQQPRRPHRRIIPTLELLEERWCPAGDVYTWNPQNPLANLNASNPANWEKNGVQQGADGTIPGNSASDGVILNGLINNNNIVWDQYFQFSTLTLMGKYNGVETINTKLDLSGMNSGTSLIADGFGGTPGYLIVKFANSDGTFEVDNKATIAAFSFNPGAVGAALSGKILQLCGQLQQPFGQFAESLLARPPAQIRLDFLA